MEIKMSIDLAAQKTENVPVTRAQLHNLFRTLLHRLMTATIRADELTIEAGKLAA